MIIKLTQDVVHTIVGTVNKGSWLLGATCSVQSIWYLVYWARPSCAAATCIMPFKHDCSCAGGRRIQLKRLWLWWCSESNTITVASVVHMIRYRYNTVCLHYRHTYTCVQCSFCSETDILLIVQVTSSHSPLLCQMNILLWSTPGQSIGIPILYIRT